MSWCIFDQTVRLEQLMKASPEAVYEILLGPEDPQGFHDFCQKKYGSVEAGARAFIEDLPRMYTELSPGWKYVNKRLKANLAEKLCEFLDLYCHPDGYYE
jgi:hypothetical protein